jgi:hypothetical protein
VNELDADGAFTDGGRRPPGSKGLPWASEAQLAEVFPGKILELGVGMRLRPPFTLAW